MDKKISQADNHNSISDDSDDNESELINRIETLLFVAHEQRSASSSSSGPSSDVLEEIPPLLNLLKRVSDKDNLTAELENLKVLIQIDTLVKQAEMMIASFINAAIENPQEAAAHYSSAIHRVIAALSKLPGSSNQVQKLREKCDAVLAKRPPVSAGIRSFKGVSRPRWVGAKSGNELQSPSSTPIPPPPPPTPKSAERTPSRTTFRRQSFGTALGLGRPTTPQQYGSSRTMSATVTPISSRPPSQLQVRSVSVNSHLPPPSPMTPRRKSLIPRLSTGNLRVELAPSAPPLPVALEVELARLLPYGCSVEKYSGSTDEYILLPLKKVFEPRLQIVSAQRVRVVARPAGSRAWVEFGGWVSSLLQTQESFSD